MRTAIVLQAVVFHRQIEADTHSVFADTCAREAPLRQAVIIAACSTVEPLKRLQPRHRPPVRVLGTMDSNRHAQRAALSRHSLANPLVLDVCSKFCPQAQICVMSLAGAQDRPAQLF